MIRSEHVRDDLKEMGDAKELSLKDVVHALSLVAKILLDIRQNQVAIMVHDKVALSTGGRRDGGKTENSTE